MGQPPPGSDFGVVIRSDLDGNMGPGDSSPFALDLTGGP